jgi:hypothetical protein
MLLRYHGRRLVVLVTSPLGDFTALGDPSLSGTVERVAFFNTIVLLLFQQGLAPFTLLPGGPEHGIIASPLPEPPLHLTTLLGSKRMSTLLKASLTFAVASFACTVLDVLFYALASHEPAPHALADAIRHTELKSRE